MPKTEQSRHKNSIQMAKKTVKKAAKKVKSATKKIAKKAVKKVAKKAVKKAAKKAAKKASPAKAKPATKKTAKQSPKKVVKKAVKPAATAAPEKFLSVNPYINFNGNCEEAFNFYKSIFGGNFSTVSRFKEMPPSENMPPISEADSNKLMHISLPISKETSLMGSDMLDGYGFTFVKGNDFTVSLNARSEKEGERLFNGLSNGGRVTMPMTKTFWGSYFGMFTDKFGIQWMVSC